MNKKLNKGALAIFVKTPGYSPIKTRLATGSSKAFAEEFHLKSAQVVFDILMQSKNDSDYAFNAPDIYWAIAEEEAMLAPTWQGQHKISQGTGPLSHRLSHVYNSLLEQYAYVGLLGADSPLIQWGPLSDGIRALSKFQFSLGKTSDGGFYFFVSNVEIELKIWESVTYSSATTAEELEQALVHKYHTPIYHLPTLFDIDDIHDLQSFLQFPESELDFGQKELMKFCRLNIGK